MNKWILTVGLEIHLELETKSKMFCGCKNDPFHSKPNTNVCPVCYGLPGALPLINRKAVEMVVMLGEVLGGKINRQTFFERKNYFYPDLPKGYQISQSVKPLVEDARLTIDGAVYRVQRIHLEEDAGKLTHTVEGNSLVDYNRAGVPLIEIVTYPDFYSAETAKRFCQEFQRVARYLKLSAADMEKGQMRCEANISVNQKSEIRNQKLGTKVEVKNINSFRSVERAINYEFNRQVKLLEAGEAVIQETRTWDEKGQKTTPMRVKETGADYRYFPEPDLPEIAISYQSSVIDHKLPEQQRQKLIEMGLDNEVAKTHVDKNDYGLLAAAERELAVYRKKSDQPLLLTAFSANLLTTARFRELAQRSIKEAVEAMAIRARNRWAKTTFHQFIRRCVETGRSPAELEREFLDNSDLEAIAALVIKENPKAVADYKKGNEAAFNFLVGQVMAKTKGRANIAKVRESLADRLK